MSRVYLPYTGHARGFLYVALALLALSVVGVVLEHPVLTIVGGSLAVTPLVVSIALGLLAKRWTRNAEELVASGGLLRWEYAAPEWQRYVDAEAARKQNVGLVLAGLFAISGLVLAALLLEDGTLVFEPALLHWLALPALGALGGLTVGAVLAGYRRARLARMRDESGVFCLGREGVYLTGSYVPLRGAATRVTGLAIEGDTLVFKFAAGRAVQRLVAPIPAERRAEAERMVARINAIAGSGNPGPAPDSRS